MINDKHAQVGAGLLRWPVMTALLSVCIAMWTGGQTAAGQVLEPVDPGLALPTREASAASSEALMQVEAGDRGAIVFRGYKNATLRDWMIRGDVAVELHDCEDITLIDCDLRKVVAGGCKNLRIVNCYIHDSEDEAVYLDDCTDVLVQGNRFERVKTGVLAHQSSKIRVVGNFCRNVLGPVPGGQLVQFDVQRAELVLVLGQIDRAFGDALDGFEAVDDVQK